VSFFWSHFDWLMKYNTATRNIGAYQKYARDLLEDPFYFWLEKTYVAPLIYVAHLLVYYLAGLAAGYWWSGGQWMPAIQFGLSLLVWGGILRTVIVWHITWSVNSLTHLFGYQTYTTDDNSRNNWFVALIATGEGWHNNHHYDQSAATVQHRWWEFDLCYYHIVVLKWLGLASHIIPPAHRRRTGPRPARLAVSPEADPQRSAVETPL
jgi:stearoyl-CoA desaturase (delta-9 desaturase)